MFRYTSKQKHVRTGIPSFLYCLYYLNMRLDLGVNIFQNTDSAALLVMLNKC